MSDERMNEAKIKDTQINSQAGGGNMEIEPETTREQMLFDLGERETLLKERKNPPSATEPSQKRPWHGIDNTLT